MAHIVIEHSANLRGRLDVQQLVRALHQAALDTGVFPIGGLRTRAYEAGSYCIADGHPDNAFVHVSVRIGHGRDLPTRRSACERIFAAACDQLAPLLETAPVGVSVEMAELDPQLSLKKNSIHEHVKRRRQAAAAQPGEEATRP